MRENLAALAGPVLSDRDVQLLDGLDWFVKGFSDPTGPGVYGVVAAVDTKAERERHYQQQEL